jgi:hypothetical protein
MQQPTHIFQYPKVTPISAAPGAQKPAVASAPAPSPRPAA